ncbi:hypothetical protein Cni_G24038 [Canna indica]|uniref:BHLH domain-containing protein n=1 Tax=Canna indica TaxID=4628 RepID=A0AAQ3L1M3_9LILI|nr:hypothetical protein Cni_G24038 [Canna indica]
MDDDDDDNKPFFHEEEEPHHNIFSWAFSLPPSHSPFGLLEPLPVPPRPPPPPQLPSSSAFVEYRASTGVDEYRRNAGVSGGYLNIHRRLIRFWRIMRMSARRASPDEGAATTTTTSRGFQHMMRERQRRERLSQSYAELHSMLSSRSKGDKISIVQSAGEYLKELQEAREELWRRNRELELMIHGNAPEAEAAALKVQVENCASSSSFDSAIAALECLKRMELEATAVRVEFAGRSSSVEVVFATEVAKETVKREMEASLAAVE